MKHTIPIPTPSFLKKITPQKLLLLAFLLLPLLLFSAMLLGSDKSISENENRRLVTRQSIDTHFLDGRFQNDLETYLSDQFPGRERIKQTETALRLRCGAHDLNGAYVGKERRLFQKITEADVDKAACRKYARKINRLAEQTGLPTYVMYVPSAGCALPDQLPYGAPMYDYGALWHELTAELPAAQVIDVGSVLRNDASAYYRTDHHWTNAGVSKAYEVWCEAHGTAPGAAYGADTRTVTEDFRGTLYSRVPSPQIHPEWIDTVTLPPHLTTEADGLEIPFYDESALQTKDKYNYFQGGNHGILTVVNPDNPNGQTLLLLKDSFANSLLPRLVYDYGKIVMLDERYAFVDVSQIAEAVSADEIGVVREIISTP